MDDNNTKATKNLKAQKKQKGAALVEYGIIVALVVVICIIAVRVIGQKVSQQFSSVASQL